MNTKTVLSARNLDPREKWLLRNVSGGAVLDVGCGDGVLTEKFGAIGVEFSRERCELAKRKVAVVRGDACHLMFHDEVFDCVVLSEVIEHLEAPSFALQETWRTLKWGGHLIITTPNYASFSWGISNEETHVVGFTPKLLANLLRKRGFAIEECGTDKFNPLEFLGPRARTSAYWLTHWLAGGFLGRWGSQICCKARKVRAKEENLESNQH